MSVIVIAIAAESGVPIFTRKRGTNDSVQFSTTASLHGINVFSKCHNVSVLNTEVDNGMIVWKEHCKSVTLIGIVTGGLECNIEGLLSIVYDAMVFNIGRKELENFKNVDHIKRDLRPCYPIIDSLMESLDPGAVTNHHPTLLLDSIECILCPQAQQLQQALDNYSECVTGRWACLSIHGRLVATSSDWYQLDVREAKLLLLLTLTQDGAPLRDTPVFLPYTSPNVAFRAVTCKLLADVYILVICGATPSLAQVDEIVLQCWENYAQTIKEAKLIYPRNFPSTLVFEPCVLGVLLINASNSKCVFSRNLHQSNQKGRAMSGAHRLDILRTFYVKAARDLVPELQHKSDNDENDVLSGISETFWCSEYHKCHARRIGDILCCTLYASTIPTHTMRLLTEQIIQNVTSNKEIHW